MKYFLPIALFLCSPSWGAITFVSSSTLGTTLGGSTAVTGNMVDTTAGDLIIIDCTCSEGASNPTPRLPSTTATNITAITTAAVTNVASNGRSAGTWYAVTTAGGLTGNTFTCKCAAGGSNVAAWVAAYRGTAATQGTPSLGIGAVNGACSGNTGTTAPCTITTTAANSLVLGCGTDWTLGFTAGAGPGQTMQWTWNSGASDSGWGVVQSAATPSSGTGVTMSVTGVGSGNEWASNAVEMLVAVSAASSAASKREKLLKLEAF